MSFPKEKQVEIVILHKENIVKLTDRILEILHEAKENKELDEKLPVFAVPKSGNG